MAAAVGPGAVADFLSSGLMPTMDVGIGSTNIYANPLHMSYGIDGVYQEGTELTNGGMQIIQGIVPASSFYQQFPLQIPVLNPGAVLGTPGAAAANCVTACFAAIGRGWNLIP